MTKILTLLIATWSLSLNAQHFRIEPLFGLMHIKQSGSLYVSKDGHSPTLYYVKLPVDRAYFSFGLGFNAWYSLNFGTSSFEKIAYGVESGIQITNGSQDRSIEEIKPSHDWNLRVPLMLGIRKGSIVDPRYGILGFGLSVGMELFRAALPEESGAYCIPKINLYLGSSRLFVGLHLYPMKMKSAYNVEGLLEDRMETSVYEITVRTAINYVPKKYRVEKRKKRKILE